jgi:hypothetical protein
MAITENYMGRDYTRYKAGEGIAQIKRFLKASMLCRFRLGARIRAVSV